MITAGRTLTGTHRLRAEVCVIGSGAGGAVVAAELAAAGRDVVLLEQGGHYTREDFDQREDHMLPLLFEESGMRSTVDGAIQILQGRVVGGSTVHNLCYCFRTPEPILRLWEEEHGVRELDLEASFERVERMLHVTQITDEELNPLNLRIKRGAELLGYRGGIAEHNRVGCVRSGFCLLGCSYDAKMSMLVTYIPKADAAGARIVSDCTADAIEGSPRARRVTATLRDGRGRPTGELSVDAPVVVCSAGAVVTPILLEESGLGASSGHLGRNLHLHPIVIATGIFPEALDSYYGIPQAYYVDEFIDLDRDPYSGYWLMPISQFPAMTAASLPGFGPELFSRLRDFARFGSLLAMLHDRSSGRVQRGSGGRPQIEYTLDEADRAELSRGLKRAVEVLWAGGAERVLVPYHVDPVVIRPEDGSVEIDRRGVTPGAIPLASAHPQSTCRMGGDPSQSVVDSWGELHDASGVFVADMSVFPTSLGAPPQITTAALADRTAHHILARWPELKP